MGQLNRPMSADAPAAAPQPVNPPPPAPPAGPPGTRAKRPPLESPNMGQLNRPLGPGGTHPPNHQTEQQ